MTLEQLQAQREDLQSARFNGVLTIKAGDKWITYKSDTEMRNALSALDKEILRQAGRQPARYLRTVCGKGL